MSGFAAFRMSTVERSYLQLSATGATATNALHSHSAGLHNNVAISVIAVLQTSLCLGVLRIKTITGTKRGESLSVHFWRR